jgi:WD40 repeat protein
LNNEYENLNVSKEWIECMRYNPQNTALGVGSHDNNIYLFKCPTYQPTYVLKGHSSFITGFDWSLDGEFIRSNCGAYELLFFDARLGT